MKKMLGSITTLPLALVFVVAAVLVGAYQAGVAFAGNVGSAAPALVIATGSATAAPTAPDPIGHPAETLSTLSKLYHSGAFLDLGIVLAFCILFALDKKFSWFNEGKQAAYVAAALGALALIAAPAAQGTTPSWSMVVAALSTAVALIINPHKQGQGTASSGS